MAAPNVLAVSPGNSETDVVLGIQIVVTFDQAIDTTTIGDATFSLSGPGQTQIITAQSVATLNPLPSTGREYIPGTFVFSSDAQGRTVVTFSPKRPLRKNVTYDIMVAGGGGLLTTKGVRNPAGEMMVNSYEWTFTTGDIDLVVPPPSSPITVMESDLDPQTLQVSVGQPVGNDLSQTVIIHFPAPIDPSSVDLSQIQMSIQAILGDPTIFIPPGLTPSVTINGNDLLITVAGWPS